MEGTSTAPTTSYSVHPGQSIRQKGSNAGSDCTASMGALNTPVARGQKSDPMGIKMRGS